MRSLSVALVLLGTIVFGGGREMVRVAAPQARLPRDARTSRDDKLLVLRWAEPRFLDACRSNAAGQANCPGAEPFIRASFPAFVGLATGKTSDAVAGARALLRAGCEDPIVLYFIARALEGDDETSREASALYERAAAGLNGRPYRAGVARFVVSGLRRDLARRAEGMGKRAAVDPFELRWFLDSLTDGSYEADDDVVLVRHLWDGTGSSLLSRNTVAISEALDRTPWVDPWVRSLVRCYRYRDDAWTARGTDFAGKVTEEGWKGFHEGLAKARAACSESWTARPDRPEAASLMTNIAMAEGEPDESLRLWFDRAVAAQLDDLPAYESMINALRTRWGGDAGALVRFARECYETRRFDTDVPLMAFQALEQMESDRIDDVARPREVRWWARLKPRPESIYRDEEIDKLVSAVLDGYLRSGTPDYARYASIYAAVSYKAGRYADARKHLRASGADLTAEAASSLLDERPAERIEAFGAPDGASAVRAEELYQSGSLSEADGLFAKAGASASSKALSYLESRRFAIAVERELPSGKPVPILPRSGLAGWMPLIGSWRADPEGELVGTSAARGLLIRCDARVGPDFDLAADIEIVSTTNGQFQAGIVFGYPTWAAHDWTSFRVKRTLHEGEVAYFSPHFESPRHSVPMPISERSHVAIRSWKGRYSAWVNGKAVETDYAPEWDSATGPDAQVGLGAYLDDNSFVVRYRNVFVRRLTAAPKGPPDNH